MVNRNFPAVTDHIRENTENHIRLDYFTGDTVITDNPIAVIPHCQNPVQYILAVISFKKNCIQLLTGLLRIILLNHYKIMILP